MSGLRGQFTSESREYKFSDRLGIGATLICLLRADEVVFDEKKLLQLGVSVTATVNLTDFGRFQTK